MIETSGVIEKEQGNGFYLVTLEQPAGHQCLCRAAGKLTKFRIKLLAGDKVLVEISPYDLTRGRITYRERNAGSPGGRPGGNRPGGHGGVEPQAGTSSCSIASLNTLRCFTPRHCCTMALLWNSCTVGVPFTPACSAIA